MYGLIGKMLAQPGKRAELLAILLDGQAQMPGCRSYIIARDPALLPALTLRFLGLTIAGLVLGATRTNVMHLLGQRFVLQIRMECFRHLMTLDLDYFTNERSGDIMSRISNDVGAVEDLVVHASDDVITNVVHIVGATFFLFMLDWRMALIALTPLPVFVGLLWILTRYIRPIFTRIRRDLGDINARLQERLAGIQVIKAFAREEVLCWISNGKMAL